MLYGFITRFVQAPDGSAQAPDGLDGPISELIGYAKWISYGLLVLAMIAAGVMVAISRSRGDGMEAFQGPFKVVAGVIIVTAAASIVDLFI